jgi:glycosyltransferase involved in cell wall biosynthesis
VEGGSNARDIVAGKLAHEHGPSARVRVLRVIARMNVGGPSYQVSLLSGRLDPERFETLLINGRVGRGEASLADLADDYGARRIDVDALSPAVDPAEDVRALRQVARIARGFRPDIVHTHTAKAGVLGRVAALTVGPPRPVVIHTYHGHVLERYFGRVKSEAYRRIERWLARHSDVLIGVSDATVSDLVRLGVAPRDKFRVIPLGLELDRFLALDEDGDPHLRDEFGIAHDDVLVTFVGRLVPIKRIDRLIRAVALAHARDPRVRLAIVGDGEERPALEALATALGHGDAVHFVGYRRDLEVVVGATDIAALSSDNEGTPVALIEAAAGARALLATRVGGVPDVVVPGSGLLVGRDDVEGFADALVELARSRRRRREMGLVGRAHVRDRYTADALLTRIADLYDELLARRVLSA